MKKLYFVLCLILLNGCGVNQEEIKKAIKLCENNGGIKFLYGYPGDNDATVICNNGAKITDMGGKIE